MSRVRVAAVVALVVAAAAPAGAQAAWSPEVTIGGDPDGNLSVGVGEAGETVVQWHEESGGVYAAFRTPGATSFSRPVRIGSNARISSMAAGRLGDAIVVWRSSRRGNPVYVSIRRRGGRFGRPKLLGRRTASVPAVAMDGRGRFGVVWAQGPSPARRVIRFAEGVDGRVVRKRTLSRRGATAPVIDRRADGGVGVAWVQGTQRSQTGRVLARVRPRGGRFRSAERLSPRGPRVARPRIAMGTGGAGMVTWRSFDSRSRRVWASDAEGAAPPVQLSDGREEAGDPVVGISAEGDATVAWVSGENVSQRFNGRIMAATRVGGEELFGPSRQLSLERISAEDARIDVNDRGDTIVLWSEGFFEDMTQRSAFRPAGAAAFGAPEVAGSGESLFADVGLDPAGNAVAAWVEFGAGGVQAAFRPEGP